jgi:protein TonB
MFATLLESGARRERRQGSISVSTLLHVALLAGGVLLTPGRRADEGIVEGPRPIMFIQPYRRLPSRGGNGHGAVGTPPAPPLGEIPIVAIDEPGLQFANDDTLSFSPIPGSPSGRAAGIPLGTGDIFAAATVEKPALPLPGNRPPIYPEMLRVAGIEGSALLQFVIDTTGRVEPSSLTVLSADNELFAAAARAALLGHRFIPAEVAGRNVRMLVQQRFDFAIAPR